MAETLAQCAPCRSNARGKRPSDKQSAHPNAADGVLAAVRSDPLHPAAPVALERHATPETQRTETAYTAAGRPPEPKTGGRWKTPTPNGKPKEATANAHIQIRYTIAGRRNETRFDETNSVPHPPSAHGQI